MSITEQAKKLGEAIAETPQFKALKGAEVAMYEDEDTSKVLNEFNALNQRLQMLQSNGQQPSQEQIQEYQNLQSQLQGNEKFTVFMEAQQEYSELMNSVNQEISSVLQDK